MTTTNVVLEYFNITPAWLISVIQLQHANSSLGIVYIATQRVRAFVRVCAEANTSASLICRMSLES